MAAWNSSSLSVSENGGLSRHSKSGLLKNTGERLSKQHIMSKRMFGNKWGNTKKPLQIGKMFRKKGKGVMKGATTAEPHKGIGPSVEEFDDMLKGTSKKKKTLFDKKQFG